MSDLVTSPLLLEKRMATETYTKKDVLELLTDIRVEIDGICDRLMKSKLTVGLPDRALDFPSTLQGALFACKEIAKAMEAA